MLLIFLKAPFPGLVKTRLATQYGDRGACEIYKKLTESVVNSAQKSGKEITLCFYPAHGEQAIRDWLGNQDKLCLQKGADLGERMKNAFIETLDDEIEKAVLIGTDIPGIDEKTISKAYERLNRCDCVLGPAEDGGYYLIGFTKDGFNHTVFDDIAWSTDSVLTETLSALDAAGVSYSLLEFKKDIDTPEDYRDYIKDK